jgi:hypothetical protein
MIVYLHKNKILVTHTALATADSCCCNCYRKEFETGDPEDPICYTFSCQRDPPGCDWIKISQGCEDCGDILCDPYIEWRIIDTSNYLYAQGPVVSQATTQILVDLPEPFIPLFYDAPPGPRSFILQAKCSKDLDNWHVLQEWDGLIELCSTINSRYPSQSLPGPWNLQKPCDKLRVDGIPLCDQHIVCVDLSPPPAPGDGQEWRDPNHETAVTFTGAEDGEWTNLANWEDANGRSPARYLPGAGSSVIIEADVTSVPTNYNISVTSLTINNNINFSIGGNNGGGTQVTCDILICKGTIDRPSPVCPEMYGKIAYNQSATFTGGTLDGELVQNGGSDAEFNADSLITTDGIMTGNAIFDDSDNEGLITGNAEFDNNSRNQNGGVVEGDAVFRNGSYNTQATVEGDAEFYDDSANSNATVEGDAEFNDTSTNDSYANVNGDATFNDSSSNQNTANVYGEATFNDSSYNIGLLADIATFNDNSYNGTGGVCQSNTTFNNSATNNGVVDTATFNNSSKNLSNGVINNAATFNNTSENEGDADGGATFNNSSINDTTGRVLNGATFNTNSINKGEASSGIFNNSSINDTTGTVTQNATFNDTSRNKGNVIGTATFDWPNACNDGGTAGTFIPADPTCP